MTRSDIAFGVIGAGGVVVTLAQSDQLIAHLHNPNAYTMTFVGGLVLISCGVLMFVPDALSRARAAVGEVQYRCDTVNYGEIPDYLRYCRQFFGNELPPIERVRAWHRKNQHILYYVKKKRRVFWGWREKVVGCFGVLPVNERTAERLAENSIIGSEFRPEDIASPVERPAAYYIGVLAAKGEWNRGQTVLALLGNLNAKREVHRVPLYTRPITKKGEDLVSKYNFVPVARQFSRPSDVIFKLE